MVELIFILVKISASGMFGVINKVFFINLFFIFVIALLFISFAPPLATMTGSRTTFLILILFKDFITALITFVECNIPIFIALGLISLAEKFI